MKASTKLSRSDVFVVIPNKNGLEHLSYSVSTLHNTSYPYYEVLLVDNGSTDRSIDFIQSRYPQITILKNNRSEGFAGAVNTGIEYALACDADYVAIFNNDIKVSTNWISCALEAFGQDNDIGIVGYTEVPRNWQGRFDEIMNLKCQLCDVRNPSGCLFVCRAHVFRKVGLFDENFFMYGEDNDFFFRVRKAGYTIVRVNTLVWHYGQGSSQNMSFLMSWLAYRNALRFAIKNLSIIQILRTFLSLLNQGCNIFRRKREDDNNWQRLRRYNVFVNFLLILGSCCWNMMHISQTIKSRRISKP